MSKHEPQICPRCQASFECKVADVANCQCNEVQVQAYTHEFLRNTAYDACLCKKCLKEVDHLLTRAKKSPMPTQAHLFIENLHYYKENGFWVFTEFYHILRGNCCQSGCRHCAYGFKKEETA